ncbi:MAG: hypothetical protein PHU63_01210 [Candidatus ainarchaeum sp.]|nr:hypothetical protein [Candidatus ainarchaeum sp.]
MVCPKLREGECIILSSPCQKPYELKMAINKCPVLLRGKSSKMQSKNKVLKSKKYLKPKIRKKVSKKSFRTSRNSSSKNSKKSGRKGLKKDISKRY